MVPYWLDEDDCWISLLFLLLTGQHTGRHTGRTSQISRSYTEDPAKTEMGVGTVGNSTVCKVPLDWMG